MVDYICQYLTEIRQRRVLPDVQPGFMKSQLPDQAPHDPESWDTIMQDVENIIMPGVVHWQSPHMHAYFPALTSWPSLLGDMLSDAINCLGFTWASSPACTELEMCVMDWLCKALGLPDHFLHHHPESRGGGILQSTVSECTLVALLASRKDKILQMKNRNSPTDTHTDAFSDTHTDMDESTLNSTLIAYASDQAHSSVEKAGLISLVKIRFLETDEKFSLRGETLQRAIQEDRRRGLVPVMLCATLGSTGVCSFDCLEELGPICACEGLWLHVDAAYAGSAFLCPELRNFLSGVEYADSFVFNPSKWMMVHFDCTAFWVKDKFKLQQTFSVDPLYLRHDNSGATDFMHWQIPLSRRFRSLKLWFVLRSFGLKNLQAHIRHGIEMAKLFESLLRSDPNFHIPAERHLGLVVFSMTEGNAFTQELLRRLTHSGTMFLIPAAVASKLIIRFTVTSQFTRPEDIHRDWSIIQRMAKEILQPGRWPRPQALSLESESETETLWQEQEVEAQHEPSMIDKHLVRQNQRRATRSMSCSAELPPTRPDPTHGLKEAPPLGMLAKIPESPEGRRTTQKRLMKFHSVPSLPQVWAQCAIQQFYWPFSKANCFNCFTHSHKHSPGPLSTK
ncbi:histidine decarboxylase isoform X1 [Tachysurus vachellii]|uniref:histidine decarboxylase isoform X1 n=1 Tax=Tachysurus vachellii TaxID=175792 RepID=UPI00296B109B|nr:histidine decarboxylase isoform X1 [Tachysurus vachellii]